MLSPSPKGLCAVPSNKTIPSLTKIRSGPAALSFVVLDSEADGEQGQSGKGRVESRYYLVIGSQNSVLERLPDGAARIKLSSKITVGVSSGGRSQAACLPCCTNDHHSSTFRRSGF